MGIECMKLKEFKTYSKEDAIPFSEFTCIVGPNGVGKSNLVDALSFALGADLSSIRGSILCRESGECPSVELLYRTTKGILISLKRKLQNDMSHYHIGEEKVTSKEYAEFLEEEGVFAYHRNFLISQNEALVKAPKDLSKLIDRISGSFEHRARYQLLKEQRDRQSKRHNELNERKKLADLEAKAYKETQDMLERHKALTERKRSLACLKLHQRKAHITEKYHSLTGQIEALKKENPLLQNTRLEEETAQIQTELIRTNAKRKALEGYLSLCHTKQEVALERLEKEKANVLQRYERALERKNEAQAQVEECAWGLKAIEENLHKKNKHTEQLDRDIILKSVKAIQKVESSVDIAHLSLQVSQTEQKIQEMDKHLAAEAEERAPAEDFTSSRLSQLNRDLLDVLRALSYHTAHRKDLEKASKLSYHVSQLKRKMAQVVGLVSELVSVEDQKYKAALHALVYTKRNTVLVDHEKNALPILNGLAQIGGGRVTLLPLNRTAPCRGGSTECPPGYIRFSDIMCTPTDPSIKAALVSYLCKDALLYLGEDTPQVKGVKIVTLDGVVISKDGILQKHQALEESQETKDLERKRDAILEAIKAEHASLKKSQKENTETVPLYSPALEALKAQLFHQKQELLEAQAYIKEKTEQIAASSQIDPSMLQQALKQGVCDRKSAERKIAQIKEKETVWKNTLKSITAHLASLTQEIDTKEAELREVLEQTQLHSAQESISQHQKRIEELEKHLSSLASLQNTPEKIELQILTEQLLSLRDEQEEIEQYAAEEGLSTSSPLAQNGAIAVEEELEKVSKDLEALTDCLKGKSTQMYAHERHTAIEKEAESAREALNETAKDLALVRKKRKDLFLSVFDKVNATFSVHYNRLTSSSSSCARAHLGLENPVEPYLGGTQVFVMPTGKTFREAKYLSGGEKTMAAVALLLSIHEIFPSPFYVFDELDAALDKENIASLREALQGINAQFIAVTHRLELFETADTLVGVAKPPQGSSQIFTLRLTPSSENNH